MHAERVRTLISELSTGLHEKEEPLRLALLAAIGGQNVFFSGPPGVAKSMLARRVAGAFRDFRTFEYLLGRFTTPEELFGPVSISRLKDADRFERVTTGFLPEADIAFLDEIWNASSPILNTLLTAINERRFRNGTEETAIPLQSVIAASGTLASTEPGLDNLWDRFLLRIIVQPVSSRDGFHRLITGPAATTLPPVTEQLRITRDELDEWNDNMETITLPEEIESLIYDIRERIERHNSMLANGGGEPIVVSDRRWKQTVQLLRSSAFLNDRTAVDAIDCLLLRHCLWSREEQIEPVSTIVAEAIRRFVQSGQFDPHTLREQYQEILDGAQEGPEGSRQITVDRPVSYRGEYYRVTDFVEDHLSLIWIGDFQNLSDEDTLETDLFFYGEQDEYAYSERFQVRRAGGHSIEIDGVTFDLEYETVTQTVRDASALTDEQKRTFREALEHFLAQVQQVQEQVRRYREHSTGEAMQHLFVHRAYVDVVIEGTDGIAAEVAMLRSEIEDTIAELR